MKVAGEEIEILLIFCRDCCERCSLMESNKKTKSSKALKFKMDFR